MASSKSFPKIVPHIKFQSAVLLQNSPKRNKILYVENLKFSLVFTYTIIIVEFLFYVNRQSNIKIGN